MSQLSTFHLGVLSETELSDSYDEQDNNIDEGEITMETLVRA
jgi:hypothetical protein